MAMCQFLLWLHFWAGEIVTPDNEVYRTSDERETSLTGDTHHAD